MNLRFHLAGEGVCHVHSGPQPLPQQLVPQQQVPLLRRLVRQVAAPRDSGSCSSFFATALGGSTGATKFGVSVLGD